MSSERTLICYQTLFSNERIDLNIEPLAYAMLAVRNTSTARRLPIDMIT